jgi:hypothetical protein
MPQNIENLGPAERIIQALLAYSDHMIHNRIGFCQKDTHSVVGAKWTYAIFREVNGEKVVFTKSKIGKKDVETRVGVLTDTKQVREGGKIVGEFRKAGIFPEVAEWMYRQVAEVYKLDNEFAARWASHAFGQEHRDLKVVLAAFMLVQARKGDPVLDAGKVAFHDEDYRDVGEAMLLLTDKDKNMSPKLLLRVREILTMPAIAKMNFDLGFAKTDRHPFYGRWETVVQKWLSFREGNPKMLNGLIKGGMRKTVQDLARYAHYKPVAPKFFELLRWEQHQSKKGHRTLAIGTEIAKAETWDALTEKEICEKITAEKFGWMAIVARIPKTVGVTQAIMAAAIESGSFSNKHLIIATPTLEELGLLQVPEIKAKWEKAIKEADDMRAANIATRVKSKEVQEKLSEAADNALKKATEEVTKNLRVYFMVDISSSMHGAIEAAKGYLSRFLQGFPPDRIHISTFNTVGKVIEIKHASAAGVENAFRGVAASGGTDYGAGILVLQNFRPKADEDVLFFFVGDEGHMATDFVRAVQNSGLNPLAFGLVPIVSHQYGRADKVRVTAAKLGIPCFEVDEKVFADPYAIPRTIRNLVAATPVGQVGYNIAKATPRLTLVDTIMKTKLLTKPQWA